MREAAEHLIKVVQFDLDELVETLLDTRWHHPWRKEVEIIKDYMPPHPRKGAKPTCVVKWRNWYLRYSVGPRQGHFWDSYGEDYHTPELALWALIQAPPPPGLGKEHKPRIESLSAQETVGKEGHYTGLWADGRIIIDGVTFRIEGYKREPDDSVTLQLKRPA